MHTRTYNLSKWPFSQDEFHAMLISGADIARRDGSEVEVTWDSESNEEAFMQRVESFLTGKPQWKLYIDMQKIRSDRDFAQIVEMLPLNIAEPYFAGFCFIVARYWNRDTAYARAFDIECSGLYCASIEVEEVSA